MPVEKRRGRYAPFSDFRECDLEVRFIPRSAVHRPNHFLEGELSN
jgi:hypothetical protein